MTSNSKIYRKFAARQTNHGNNHAIDKVKYWLDIADNDLTVAEDLYKMGLGCMLHSCATKSLKRC